MRRTKRGGWPYSQSPNVPFIVNRASPQAKGLIAWWPTLASRGGLMREFLKYGIETVVAPGYTWVQHSEIGAMMCFTNDVGRMTAKRDYGLTGADAYSLSAWFVPTNIPQAHNFVLGTDRIGGWRYMGNLYCGGFGAAAIQAQYYDDGAAARGLAGGNATVGQLYHWLFVNEPTGVGAGKTRLYMNGVLADSHATKVNDTYQFADLSFGAREGGSGPLGVDIGDTRLYSRALNDTNAWQLYDQETRWELYGPLIQRWAGWKSPVVERIPRYGFTNFQVPGIV